MANPKLLCGIGCGICILLVSLILILVSIGTVEPIEYAIEYNSFTKKTNEDNVYAGGWYMIGPISSFITFPATLVNYDWSDYENSKATPLTNVKDNGNQDMSISFSIQYKLTEENIGKLYSKYKTVYENTFRQWADTAVRDTVGKFGTTAFWTDRAASAEKMRAAIDKKFKSESDMVSCVNLQILYVKLTDKREQSLIETQVSKQQGKTKTKEQKAKEIRSQISVIDSQSKKNITQLQGNGTALAKAVAANASSISTNMTITAQSAAYKTLETEIGISPANILDQFIYYSALQTADNVQMLKGINKAIIKL